MSDSTFCYLFFVFLFPCIKNSNPNSQTFVKLLEDHQDIFHKSRTAKTIHNHWLLMKHYQLLSDQSGESYI